MALENSELKGFIIYLSCVSVCTHLTFNNVKIIACVQGPKFTFLSTIQMASVKNSKRRDRLISEEEGEAGVELKVKQKV